MLCLFGLRHSDIMGGRESKQCCINYEDAIKRVSESELRRLKDAFKKSAGIGRFYLSRNAFQNDVLFEGVPTRFTELLYTACGGTSKGITFKDLLCGLVLLTRGTEDEKLRFLWNLYCNDTCTYIQKSDYLRTVGLQPSESVSLFSQGDRVSFDQFHDWILEHKNSSILSSWLLSGPCVNLTSELETPTFYQSLAGVTHLEEKDIGDLEKEFWCLKSSSPNTNLDLQLLGPLISPPIPKSALVGLFNAFDENRDGHIDFKELCCGVSAACRGPEVERTRFCFKIFDVDRDGVLNHMEIIQMINVLTFVAKESRNSHLYKEVTKQNALGDLLSFAVKKKKTITKEVTENQMNTETNNLSITVEDFMMWSVESNFNLVQPFLDLTFEVCHIVFGLWPQCKHLEHDIVCGWLEREKKRHYRVGQFWYLISHDWWLSWIRYTQNSVGLCHYCKRSSPCQRGINGIIGVIDEALVCDESLNSNSLETISDSAATGDNCSLGSTSSGISTGRYPGARPGPIDNMGLVKNNPYKNVRTLTGEGGHLRRDTPLVENHDFQLVPKSLWKALNRWYGDNLPLPRQVIQSPNSTQMELELYPLNLRIVLHQSMSNMPSWGAVSGGYGVVASGGGYISAANVPQPPKRYLAYTAAFSRLATVHQICEFLCAQLRLRAEDVRLWHIQPGSIENSAILLEEEHMTLKELLIKDSDQILLEIRNKDLTWPEELGSLTLNQSGSITMGEHHYSRSSITSVHAPGAIGLHNLGNTCFMNAALQVLFNTQPLAQYFRLNMHLFELNTTNKLGTRGQLALRYSELLKEMLSSTSRSVAPLKLRFCVTKHAPQFAGGGQHDSQELLEWFLDALHEDLNRVTEKPYSELKDSNGRPDKIVATEAWTQHHARNQSIIIDLFYGQLKSKVSCLGCGQESVRFDPFSLLSLPLPVENYVYFEVLVVLLDGSIPIKYGLRLNPEAKYIDMKEKLSLMCNLKPAFMLVCEVYNSQIRLILPDQQKVKPATAKELYVYQMPEECSDRSRTSSMNIEKGLKDIQRSAALIIGNDSLNSFTSPIPLNSTQKWRSSDSKPCTTDLEDDIPEHTTYPVTKKNVFISHDTEDDDHHSTKQSFEIGRSPENSFVDSYNKQISSTKLLSTECHNMPPPTSSSFMSQHEHDSMEGQQQQQQQQRSYVSYNACNNSVCLEGSGCACKLNSTEMGMGGGGGELSQENNCFNSFDDNLITTTTRRQHDFDYDDVDENVGAIGDCSNNSNSKNQLQNYSTTDNVDLFRQAYLQQCKVGKYLIAVHRKITRQDSYFLSHHKTRPSLFGVPLLIPNTENATHKDMYCSVWLQVNRLLSPLPAFTDQSNHAADCDDSLGYDFPFILRAVKSDGLTCAYCAWSSFCRGCEIPCNDDYLFKGSKKSSISALSITSHLATKEIIANDKSNNFNSNEEKFNTTEYVDDFTIAIDWDPTALHLRYQSTLERLCKDHESVAICRKEQVEPVDLNHCLRAFTSEEKLEEWYHCGHCKGKKPATKKLQIWKLPPILIVHLKRFNCVNEKWVKSQKVVHFPFDNFDPTPYLASVPQETILRHRELQELHHHEIDENSFDEEKNENQLTDIGECDNQQESNQQENQFIFEEETDDDNNDGDDEEEENDINEVNNGEGESFRNNGNKLLVKNSINTTTTAAENCTQLDDCCNIVPVHNNKTNPNPYPNPNHNNKNNENKNDDNNEHKNLNHNKNLHGNISNVTSRSRKSVAAAGKKLRKRLISTSLTKTPIIDGKFEDYHQHKLKEGEDKFDPKYKLYAVVCHSGMLSGGHYISYAANQAGTWYCFNDSSCREIPNQPNIDPSSAYLLFYERKGLDYEPYLPNIDGKQLPIGGLETDSDDGSNDLKKLCRIS